MKEIKVLYDRTFPLQPMGVRAFAVGDSGLFKKIYIKSPNGIKLT